ncbi:MAG: hypothetical protein K8I27_08760, partial [Planctomycetes bacterium]|nr:hypothetical protein [Planctomycetota bacterium]
GGVLRFRPFCRLGIGLHVLEALFSLVLVHVKLPGLKRHQEPTRACDISAAASDMQQPGLLGPGLSTY